MDGSKGCGRGLLIQVNYLASLFSLHLAESPALSETSMSNDLTSMKDKPLLPLSSYGAAKYEPNLITSQEESPEELRVRAVMALKAGNSNEYVSIAIGHSCLRRADIWKIKYETERIAAAEQVFAVRHIPTPSHTVLQV